MTKEQWQKRQEQWRRFNAWERTQPKGRTFTMEEILEFVKKVRQDE